MNWLVSAISGSMISACPPCFERARHRLEIDLRLARAGDAVEQRDGEVPRVDGAASVSTARAWSSDKCLRRVAGLRARHARSGIATSTRVPAATSPSMTPVEQPASRRQRGFGADQAIGGDVQGALARRRHARRVRPHLRRGERRSGASLARTPRRRSSSCARPCRAVPACSARPTRQSAAKSGAAAAHRCGSVMRLELFGVDGLAGRRRGPSQTMPMRVCGPNGTSTKAPGAASSVRHQVIVGLVERDRQQHGHAAGAARSAVIRMLRADFPKRASTD